MFVHISPNRKINEIEYFHGGEVDKDPVFAYPKPEFFNNKVKEFYKFIKDRLAKSIIEIVTDDM